MLLHFATVSTTFLLPEKKKEAPIEIEVVENKGGNSDSDKNGKYEKGGKSIKELGDNAIEEAKNFYWGLGFYSADYIDTFPGYGPMRSVEVLEFVSEYCGAHSGLHLHDVIFLINGQPRTDSNDIKGNEPKTLELTLSRNHSIMVITVKRCKVYT